MELLNIGDSARALQATVTSLKSIVSESKKEAVKQEKIIRVQHDRLEEYKREVKELKREVSALASTSKRRVNAHFVYKGNSIGYIYDKMTCYRDQVGMAFDALRNIGFNTMQYKDNCELLEGLALFTQKIHMKIHTRGK